jgi:hypothetical protein
MSRLTGDPSSVVVVGPGNTRRGILVVDGNTTGRSVQPGGPEVDIEEEA